jgi:hypothetical protein
MVLHGHQYCAYCRTDSWVGDAQRTIAIIEHFDVLELGDADFVTQIFSSLSMDEDAPRLRIVYNIADPLSKLWREVRDEISEVLGVHDFFIVRNDIVVDWDALVGTGGCFTINPRGQGGGKRARVAGSKGGNKEEKIEEIAEHLGLTVVRVANSYLHTAPTDEMNNNIMQKMREIQAGVRISDQVLAGMSEADMTSISASLLSTNGEKKVTDFAKIAFANEFRAINELRKVLSTLESGMVGLAEMMLVNDFPKSDGSGVISWESLSQAVLAATARRGVAVGRAQAAAAATPAVGAPLA